MRASSNDSTHLFMNDIQLEQYKQKLDVLEKFTKEHSSFEYEESEIIDWIASCVNLFYEIGVDQTIIRDFLDHFRSGVETVDVNTFMGGKERVNLSTIGPFRQEKPPHYSIFTSGKYILAGSFYYSTIAFSVARNTLKNQLSEKRIVPFWLIEQFRANEKLHYLGSSLELLENKYEAKDTDGLASEALTLLGSVLDLVSELPKRDKIGSKLNTLIDNDALREKFGVSSDLVKGLNAGRILRNEKISHKQVNMKYNFPFLVATSFAYLVIFFVECTISNGKIFDA